MTVPEMLDRMGSDEFAKWIAYSQICPFGEDRADVRCAIIAKTIADVNRAKEEAPYKLEPFMAYSENRQREAPLTGKAGALAAKHMFKNA